METTNTPGRRWPTAFLLAALVALTGMVAGLAPAASAAPDDRAKAQSGTHFYILIPGSCDREGTAYDAVIANQIEPSGAEARKVDYEASAPPLPCSNMGYNDSVQQGRAAAIEEIEAAYNQDPNGHFTVVGYSQGAHVANLLLEAIADGNTVVPKEQVDAKLYADPMQPGTGIGTVLPKGTPFFSYVSPGPGRTDFNGIPFLRYCIETDGVCDMRDPFQAPGGYVMQHGCYPGSVFHTITDGVFSNESHFWPRINCGP